MVNTITVHTRHGRAADERTFHLGDPVLFINHDARTYTVGRVESILSRSYQLCAVLLDGGSPLCRSIDEFDTLLAEPPAGYRRIRTHWATGPSARAWN